MFIQAKTFAVRTWQPPNWTVLPNTGPSAPASEIQSPMDEEHAIPIDGGGGEESLIEGKQAQSIGSSTEKTLSDLTEHGVPTITTTLDLAQPGALVLQPPELAKRPKRPKKRRPNESQNYYQSLGDKAQSLSPFLVMLADHGCSGGGGRCRSNHWGRLYLWRP
jgi:hypothetical protein